MYASAKDHWKDFAADARAMGSPLYAELALAIDGDEELKALTAGRRQGQPAANLLLAAAHFLLLQGAQHPLREFYPTVFPRFVESRKYSVPLFGRGSGRKTAAHFSWNRSSLGGARTGAADLFARFRDFVCSHKGQIAGLVESRVTNTNEVGRSAVLRAGFAALAQQEKAPLHLIEIGPSAGLNLIWDRYGVRYHRGGAVAAEVLPEAKLVLSCELKGEGAPPVERVPRIAGRLGLERNPVDLANPDDRDWLKALVWPDQPERLARLEAAIALFLEQPAEIRAGDALKLLPTALADAPPGAAVCVYHTITTYQFSEEMLAALEAILAGRPVWRLSFEFDRGRDYAVNLTHHGRGEARRLALAQPHGAWMAWRGG